MPGAADRRRAQAAGSVFDQVVLSEEFVGFLTLPAYELID